MPAYKSIKKLVKKWRSIPIHWVLKHKNFNAENSFIIFSETRSGSTWLMEMLIKTLHVCPNWEPLHVKNGVVPKSFQFGWRPYLPITETNEKYITFFKNIHAFKLYNSWTTNYINLFKLLKSKQVLVKYVRANRLIPYLLQHFNFNYKPIFLIRHPIDTCISQHQNCSKTSHAPFKVPENLNDEKYKDHQNFINSLTTNLEFQVANWCINNCDTINKLNELNVHVIFYSDLLLNPKNELKKYLKQNNLSHFIINLEKVNYKKASASNFKKQFKSNTEKQLYKNLNLLDQSTKNKIQAVFNYFNFKLYSAYSPFPNK